MTDNKPGKASGRKEVASLSSSSSNEVRGPMKTLSRMREELALIKRSGLLAPDYYRAQLPWWQRGPKWLAALHYRYLGWRRGLNPCPRFDTQWYLSQYQDVSEAGLNPLLHFLRYGAFEGRQTAPGVSVCDLDYLKGTPVWLEAQLWHGHARRALTPLHDLARQGSAQAAWCLAGWYFAHERFERALEILAMPLAPGETIEPAQLHQARLKCYLRQSDDDAVRKLPLAGGSCMTRAMHALSRLDDPTEQRLASLNALLAEESLVPLQLHDREYPLSSTNLAGRASLTRRRRRMPSVSVIVPVRNVIDTLASVLHGLMEQSWPDLEILIVDDASDDATREIASKLIQRHPSIRLLSHPFSRGAYAARNTGLAAARGEFITVHDGDDWSHPQKIECQVMALLDQPEAMASFSHWVRVDGQLRCLGPWHLCNEWIEVNPSSLLMRREVLESLGDWDAVKVAADNEMFARITRRYGSKALIAVYPDLPLSFALTRPSSLTRSRPTHVRTVRGGLRELYHQSARWWHQRHLWPVMSSIGPGNAGSARRSFPAPIGNCVSFVGELDVLVLADLSERNPELQQLLKTVLELRYKNLGVVLFPWTQPDDFASSTVANEIWELCHEEEILLAAPGDPLSCRTVCLQASVAPGDSYPEDWPDRTPQLSHPPERISGLDGQPLKSAIAEQLVSYLLAGGESDGVLYDDPR